MAPTHAYPKCQITAECNRCLVCQRPADLILLARGSVSRGWIDTRDDGSQQCTGYGNDTRGNANTSTLQRQGHFRRLPHSVVIVSGAARHRSRPEHGGSCGKLRPTLSSTRNDLGAGNSCARNQSFETICSHTSNNLCDNSTTGINKELLWRVGYSVVHSDDPARVRNDGKERYRGSEKSSDIGDRVIKNHCNQSRSAGVSVLHHKCLKFRLLFYTRHAPAGEKINYNEMPA